VLYATLIAFNLPAQSKGKGDELLCNGLYYLRGILWKMLERPSYRCANRTFGNVFRRFASDKVTRCNILYPALASPYYRVAEKHVFVQIRLIMLLTLSS